MTADQRPFGFWTATALVVGGMIGSGIFMLPVSLAGTGWTGVLAWGGSIAGALAIAYTLARLAAAVPQATGAVAVTGAALGTLPGVLVGWSYWVSVWAANAAIAISATSYLSVFVPALNATPLTGALSAVAMIWLLTLLNLGGARLAGQFQVVTTALKLIPLLVVAGTVLFLGLGGGPELHPAVPAPVGLSGLTAAVALTLFPLVGFEAAGVAEERVRDPARNVMRATMAGTALTGLLYVIVCSGIVLMLPTDALQASAAPFELFAGTYLGRGAALAISGFAAVAAIGALNGWVLIVGEVPLGMARAGLLPRWCAAVNARDVPVRMLLISAALASLLVLFNASKSLAGVFQFAALLTTCSTLWLYVAVCLAALRMRVAVATAAVGLPFTAWAFWGAGVEAAGLSVVLMLAGLPAYWARGWGRPLSPTA